ncbi:dienelactone hydrolase family-domain-containing protein [Corynascus novoguineensis]|uniref:Dienelactone hydrolase family-domain-containing protein n=1 Tax=Corynascus novoguineensis TaxID=1126955 RepID=A0AAN7CM86_9PEZI|nr:dienelactone hydrolase family-domain-containing protein [Corynascus novoguineensis]
MRAFSLSLLYTGLLVVGEAVSGCHGKSSDCVDASIIAHTGEPLGKEVQYSNVTIYVAKPDPENPRTKPRAGIVLIYLSDIFGLGIPENKLLADSYARAGYLTVVPDLFDGSPAPSDLNTPGFNLTAFLEAHEPAVIDPIIAAAFGYARERLNATRFATPGYCFGGRHAFRVLSSLLSDHADVAFAAHPTLLGLDEVASADKPAALATAENDEYLDGDARLALEKALAAAGYPYQVNLYSGTEHAFGVRVPLDDPEQKYAKEEAFSQAVRWFDRFLVKGTEGEAE